MSDHLAWQLLVTRWLILFVIAFVVGIFCNGVTLVVAKDKEPYKGKWLWPSIFTFLAAVHIGGFLYRHSLPHWLLSMNAGFFTALGTTFLIRWIFSLITVKANVIAAILSCAAFAIVANFTPVEAVLMDWFKHL